MQENNKPLIVYITDSEILGGAEGYLETLLVNVDKNHYRVALILPPRSATESLVKKAYANGVKVYYLEHVHIEGLRPQIIWRSWCLFRKLKPNIIHFVLPSPRRSAESVIAAALACIPYRIATFQLVTGVPSFPGLIGWLRKINRKAQYRLFHAGIAVSQGNQTLLLEQHEFPAKRLHYIPNAVDTTKWYSVRRSDIRARWNIASDVPVVGVVGRLSPQKGHGILFSALPTVWRHHPQAHVIVVGQGELEEQLKTQAQDIDQEGRIHFLGQQQTMIDVFAGMDILVLPSLYEGLSFALLEAMATEKAIVASCTDGTTEVLKHYENGILFPIGDSTKLASELIYLLNHPEEQVKFGQAARETVLGRYDLQKNLAETWNLYPK